MKLMERVVTLCMHLHTALINDVTCICVSVFTYKKFLTTKHNQKLQDVRAVRAAPAEGTRPNPAAWRLIAALCRRSLITDSRLWTVEWWCGTEGGWSASVVQSSAIVHILCTVYRLQVGLLSLYCEHTAYRLQAGLLSCQSCSCLVTGCYRALGDWLAQKHSLKSPCPSARSSSHRFPRFG